MKNTILYLCLFGLFLSGCDVQELRTYDGDRFVQFENDAVDSTILSFRFFPGVENYELPLVLNLVGDAANHDLRYKVYADPKFTTAEEDKHYSLPENMVIRAGKYSDTLYLRLNKTADLNTKKVKLLLRFENTSDLKSGKVEKSVAIIQFSNMVDRPEWWDSTIESYYLGKYSDKKFELFIDVTGEYDLSEMDDSSKRSLALEFGQYLIDHPTLDEDGQYMTVTVLGLE